ncbi:hypothetical protein ODJ79_32045 [Actinoplanes sp. KI2]|nr:hypothetical protein [Actinoplanes sp. KI2]MCU7728366.1 hypothetical protein [Actinoplanes sp. KI2]
MRSTLAVLLSAVLAGGFPATHPRGVTGGDGNQNTGPQRTEIVFACRNAL